MENNQNIANNFKIENAKKIILDRLYDNDKNDKNISDFIESCKTICLDNSEIENNLVDLTISKTNNGSEPARYHHNPSENKIGEVVIYQDKIDKKSYYDIMFLIFHELGHCKDLNTKNNEKNLSCYYDKNSNSEIAKLLHHEKFKNSHPLVRDKLMNFAWAASPNEISADNFALENIDEIFNENSFSNLKVLSEHNKKKKFTNSRHDKCVKALPFMENAAKKVNGILNKQKNKSENKHATSKNSQQQDTQENNPIEIERE